MANNHSTVTAPDASSARSRKHRSRRAIAAAVVGLLALSACTSDPGPRRVATDIIEAEAENNPDLDVECLTDAVDEFSDDELTAIHNDLTASNAEQNADGEAALEEFRQALAACN